MYMYLGGSNVMSITVLGGTDTLAIEMIRCIE